MNLCSISVILLVVLVLMLVFNVDHIEARREKKEKKAKAGVCKYDRKGEEGPCNSANNTKEVTLRLKKGDPATCQPTKTVSKPCNDNSLSKKKKIRGCKYDKKGSDWTACDPETNQRSRVLKLKSSSNPECPPTHTRTKSCGGKKKKAARKSRKDA